MTSRMLVFHVPKDEELLSAIGVVTIRHEQLNHILKMTIKSIANLTTKEAVDATQYKGSSTLRHLVRKLARQRLGEGEPLLKLQAMLTRASKLTEQRNELTHGLWAQELDGDPGVLGALGKLNPLPSVKQLNALAKDIEELTIEFNVARLEGFLKVALDNKPKV